MAWEGGTTVSRDPGASRVGTLELHMLQILFGWLMVWAKGESPQRRGDVRPPPRNAFIERATEDDTSPARRACGSMR